MESSIINKNTNGDICLIEQIKNAKASIKIELEEKEYLFDLSPKEIRDLVNVFIYVESKNEKIANIILSNKNEYDVLFIHYIHNFTNINMEEFNGKITTSKLEHLIKEKGVLSCKELLNEFLDDPLMLRLKGKRTEEEFLMSFDDLIIKELFNFTDEQLDKNPNERFIHHVVASKFFLEKLLNSYYNDNLSLSIADKLICHFPYINPYINNYNLEKIKELNSLGDIEKKQKLFSELLKKPYMGNVLVKLFRLEEVPKLFEYFIINNEQEYIDNLDQVIQHFIGAYFNEVRDSYNIENYIVEYMRNEYIIKKKNLINCNYLRCCNIFKDEELLIALEEINNKNGKYYIYNNRVHYMDRFTEYLLEFNPLERYKIIKKYKLYWLFNDKLIADVINPRYFIQNVLLLLSKREFFENIDFKESINKFIQTYNLNLKKIVDYCILNKISHNVLEFIISCFNSENIDENIVQYFEGNY